jgi:hypothetical protein
MGTKIIPTDDSRVEPARATQAPDPPPDKDSDARAARCRAMSPEAPDRGLRGRAPSPRAQVRVLASRT